MKWSRGDFLIVAIVVAFFAIATVPIYFRVMGDIAVCREFYPSMNKLECYFSSKTVRVPK